MGESRYVLATGAEAAERLRVVQRVHGPDTERFLHRAGLRPGFRVADIGCGAGIVAAWIAEQVGGSGEVWAVDVSPEQVEQARSEAARRSLRNVRFVVAGALNTGLPRGSFDLVYCRFVLMHLDDPLAALREMRALLRPGGVLACEDGDFAAPYCHPPLPAFDRCFELYRALGHAQGQHFLVGRELPRLFLEAGFGDPHVALAQPVFLRGAEKRLPVWTLKECAPALAKTGLATEEEVTALCQELERQAADETTLVAMARMTQVWAVR